MMTLLTKIASNINLKMSKVVILDAWLGADGYIAGLKIQTKIRKDGRHVRLYCQYRCLYRQVLKN